MQSLPATLAAGRQRFWESSSAHTDLPFPKDKNMMVLPWLEGQKEKRQGQDKKTSLSITLGPLETIASKKNYPRYLSAPWLSSTSYDAVYGTSLATLRQKLRHCPWKPQFIPVFPTKTFFLFSLYSVTLQSDTSQLKVGPGLHPQSFFFSFFSVDLQWTFSPWWFQILCSPFKRKAQSHLNIIIIKNRFQECHGSHTLQTELLTSKPKFIICSKLQQSCDKKKRFLGQIILQVQEVCFILRGEFVKTQLGLCAIRVDINWNNL